MKLQGILHKIQELKEYSQIKQCLNAGAAYSAELLASARPAFVSALACDLACPVLLITASPEDASKRIEQLRVWSPEDVPVIPFPELDSLPFERILPDPSTTHDRIKALFKLASRNKQKLNSFIIVASASALLSRTPVWEPFKKSIYHLYPGMRVSPVSLLEKFQQLGYILETNTELPGNMSHRGGIIDIFPPYLENPVRIDFIGNEIESLRFFNPINQRSIGEIKGLEVSMAREMMPSKPGESLQAILKFLFLESFTY